MPLTAQCPNRKRALNFHKLKIQNNLPKFYVQALLQQSHENKEKTKNKVHEKSFGNPKDYPHLFLEAKIFTFL